MARLTDAIIEALRGSYTEYPERTSTPPFYPSPRPRRTLNLRTQPPPLTDASGAPLPPQPAQLNMRIWSIILVNNVAGRYNQRGSPRLAGPCLLLDFIGLIDIGGIATPTDGVQLTYSQSPIPAVDSTDLTLRCPGTPIAEAMAPYYTGTQYTIRHTDSFAFETNLGGTRYPLGVYIPYPEAYIGVAIADANPSARYVQGYFRILEGATPDMMLTA